MADILLLVDSVGIKLPIAHQPGRLRSCRRRISSMMLGTIIARPISDIRMVPKVSSIIIPMVPNTKAATMFMPISARPRRMYRFRFNRLSCLLYRSSILFAEEKFFTKPEIPADKLNCQQV